MTTQLFANNAYGALSASITNVATSMVLVTGQGARFPAITGSDYFLLTLVGLDVLGAENAWEIVKVTARTTDTLTITRAQDSTSAVAWASGSRVELRASATAMTDPKHASLGVSGNATVGGTLDVGGIVTMPTAARGTNTTQGATTAFVHGAVADLVASSPAALDTLNELAAALGNDANFASTMTTSLASKQATASKDATGGYAGLTAFKINFKNALNTFTSFFTNANTAARTYTFQDRDGTIADNTDLALKANLASPTFTGTVTTAVLNASGTISGASGVLGLQSAPTAISAANIANNSVVGIRTGTPDVAISGGEGSGLKLQTLSGRGGIFLGALSPTSNKDFSQLVVYTGSDNGVTYTEKLRLDNAGKLLIGTATQFNGTDLLQVNGGATIAGEVSLGGASGAEGLRVITVPSAVNRVQINGQATGGTPVVSAQGLDSNITLMMTGKGTGGISLTSNNASNNIAIFEHRASSVNYFRFIPSATGGTPTIGVGGTDTNITLAINGKGSGGINLYSNDGSNLIASFAHTGGTVNYHTIYGGATGAPVTLEARGSDTNVGINLLPKGTGVVSVAGALSVTGASTFSGTAVHSDQQLTQAMLKDCAVVAVDKGNSSTTTQTFDYTAGSKQKVTATGNHTFAFSNWPPTGNEGYMRVDFINYGAYTITPPTVTWTNPDGSETTSLSTHFTALAAAGGRSGFTASGITKAIFWSSDAGTTVYGKFI